MKRLFVASLVAVLGVALSTVVTQSPSHSSSAAKPTEEAMYIQARAAFKKYLSSHAPLIRAEAPSSAGAPPVHTQGASMAAVASGGVQVLPSVNWSGYADVDSSASSNASAPGSLSGVSARWTLP